MHIHQSQQQHIVGKDAEFVESCGVIAHMSLWAAAAAAAASPVLFTQAVFSSEGVLWLRGKPLMLLLLSVVVPEQNNCSAFVCFLHLVPLSRPKATDFVGVYKIEKDIFSVLCICFFFLMLPALGCLCSYLFIECSLKLCNSDDQGFNDRWKQCFCKTFLFVPLHGL